MKDSGRVGREKWVVEGELAYCVVVRFLKDGRDVGNSDLVVKWWEA